MKKIGFIGAYDKTDLIIYVAKILETLNQKVLVIDATINQKARYVVPVISPTTEYVTEYEDIDIAVGFSNEESIKRYLGLADDQEMEYDIVLVCLQYVFLHNSICIIHCYCQYIMISAFYICIITDS